MEDEELKRDKKRTTFSREFRSACTQMLREKKNERSLTKLPQFRNFTDRNLHKDSSWTRIPANKCDQKKKCNLQNDAIFPVIFF